MRRETVSTRERDMGNWSDQFPIRGCGGFFRVKWRILLCNRRRAKIEGTGTTMLRDEFFRRHAVKRVHHQIAAQHGTLEAYARIANTLYDAGGTFESLLFTDPCTEPASPDYSSLNAL